MAPNDSWENLPWFLLEQDLFRLQKRIYQASLRGDDRRGDAAGAACSSGTAIFGMSITSPPNPKGAPMPRTTCNCCTVTVIRRSTGNHAEVWMTTTKQLRSRMRWKLSRPVLKPSGGSDPFA